MGRVRSKRSKRIRPSVVSPSHSDSPPANDVGASISTPEDSCLNFSAMSAEPEYRRQLAAGLIDVYGRPLRPEGRDFFSEYHRDHEH